MAWKARLSQDLYASGLQIVVPIEYYNDQDAVASGAAFPPSLYAQTFYMGRDQTVGQIQTDIQAAGQIARAVQARASSLVAQFPVASTIINIP